MFKNKTKYHYNYKYIYIYLIGVYNITLLIYIIFVKIYRKLILYY